MTNRLKSLLPAATLTLVSQVPAIAMAQASSPASAASQPPKTDVTVIDPTFFIAIGVALVIGFFIGRLSTGKRAALQ
jgi:hypothetical protein